MSGRFAAVALARVVQADAGGFLFGPTDPRGTDKISPMLTLSTIVTVASIAFLASATNEPRTMIASG